MCLIIKDGLRAMPPRSPQDQIKGYALALSKDGLRAIPPQTPEERGVNDFHGFLEKTGIFLKRGALHIAFGGATFSPGVQKTGEKWSCFSHFLQCLFPGKSLNIKNLIQKNLKSHKKMVTHDGDMPPAPF